MDASKPAGEQVEVNATCWSSVVCFAVHPGNDGGISAGALPQTPRFSRHRSDVQWAKVASRCLVCAGFCPASRREASHERTSDWTSEPCPQQISGVWGQSPQRTTKRHHSPDEPKKSALISCLSWIVTRHVLSAGSRRPARYPFPGPARRLRRCTSGSVVRCGIASADSAVRRPRR